MNSIVTRTLLACCPQTSFLLSSSSRRDYTSSEDEYEKYEPRPQIVINPDTESLKSCSSERQLNGLLLGNVGPTLAVAAQYSSQKTTVIVKIATLYGFENGSENEEDYSVRIIVEDSKNPKQMTTYLTSNKAIRFKETFIFPGVSEASIMSTGIKFRIYSRKGNYKGTLRGEGLIEGKEISFDGPQNSIVPITQVHALKSEPSAIDSVQLVLVLLVNHPIEEELDFEQAKMSKHWAFYLVSTMMNSHPVSYAVDETGLSPSMHRMSNGSFANGDSRRSSMVDACGRFCSQPNAESPELQLALCYDQEQNCVTITIEKGSQIGDKNKPPDTFVKMCASLEFGSEFWRSKTDLMKGTTEPQYDFSTTVQLPKGQIENTTIKIEVWQSIGMLRRRCLLGAISVGLNSSSPDAQEHWEQMVKAHGIAISKWHTLNGQDS